MPQDINQDLIDELLLLSKDSDKKLQKNIKKLLDIYSTQKIALSRSQKQNNFFIKQWDKKNILTHEKDVQKDKMLEQQSKMAAMGEMMDAVAHQWKQPLNSLSMISDMLKDDFTKGIVDSKYIDEITQTTQNQIKHMLSTLSEFRTFFRPTKDNVITPFHLQNCIESVQILMKDELIVHNITLYIDIEEDLKVSAEENEVKHLFINLISNSIDAFEEIKKLSRHIYIRAYNENSKIYIEVEDNAGGIPTNVIDDIFKPNITTKKEGKGTGIGLYMSSQIVQKYHGSINVHNSNMGAFFTIQFKK